MCTFIHFQIWFFSSKDIISPETRPRFSTNFQCCKQQLAADDSAQLKHLAFSVNRSISAKRYAINYVNFVFVPFQVSQICLIENIVKSPIPK